MSAASSDPVYAAYLAKRKSLERVKEVMANCEHWGHPDGEWKMACCACSGVPGGCENCSGLLMEQMGLA